ncbi:hypothetical protein KJ567_06635 [Candidatus Bipolaricaulota bacterium]|nr:hypothetical protein [Candidatus Bipolaricaulota bacterium]
MHRTKTARVASVVSLAMAIGLCVLANPITAGNVGTLTEEGRIDVGFYPDNVFFLSDARVAIVDGQGAHTVIWNVPASGAEAVQEPRMGKILDVSEDLSTLAVCTHAGDVSIWTADPLVHVFDLCALQHTPVPRAAFSPDGRLLAITDERDEIELWDLESGALTTTLIGHDSNVFDLAFSPDGSVLATAGGWSGSTADADSCVKIWDVTTADLIVSLSTIDLGDNHAIAFAGDGARLISGGIERLVAWDTASWERVYDSGSSYPGSYGMAVSPSQELLAIAYWGGSVRVMDLGTMSRLRDLQAPDTPFDVAFSPDGSRLAASFADGTIVVWKVP